MEPPQLIHIIEILSDMCAEVWPLHLLLVSVAQHGSLAHQNRQHLTVIFMEEEWSDHSCTG
jgi:hypothetical protein